VSNIVETNKQTNNVQYQNEISMNLKDTDRTLHVHSSIGSGYCLTKSIMPKWQNNFGS